MKKYGTKEEILNQIKQELTNDKYISDFIDKNELTKEEVAKVYLETYDLLAKAKSIPEQLDELHKYILSNIESEPLMILLTEVAVWQFIMISATPNNQDDLLTEFLKEVAVWQFIMISATPNNQDDLLTELLEMNDMDSKVQ